MAVRRPMHPQADKGFRVRFQPRADDVQAFVTEMKSKSVACSPVREERWGSITKVTLPGGGTLGVYQPKHASPLVTKSH